MRLVGTITDAKYRSGVSQNTGNSYELTNYVVSISDQQGHNHLLAFVLMGDKMRQEAVHKGDVVEVSVQLGIREYNGNTYNDVKNVYFVGKMVNGQLVGGGQVLKSEAVNVMPNGSSRSVQGQTQQTHVGQPTQPYTAQPVVQPTQAPAQQNIQPSAPLMQQGQQGDELLF